MENINKMIEARKKKREQTKAKNKQIGISLSELKKEAKVRPPAKVGEFFFKGEADSVPSKVKRAEAHRSPLKLSRNTRNIEKCGYNTKAEAYVRRTDGFNPFDSYALQNLGTLESFIQTCCSHRSDSGCKGSFKFISPELVDIPLSFRGTLFSVNTVQCNECGDKYQLESDYFEVKPTATNKISCFSRVSQVAGIASKNMSWVFSEMHMLFACVGLVFFSVKNFLFLRDLQGAEIIKLTDEVVSANLEREIEMVKHGKGLPQGVVKQRKTAYTPEQVNSMRSDQLKGV